MFDLKMQIYFLLSIFCLNQDLRDSRIARIFCQPSGVSGEICELSEPGFMGFWDLQDCGFCRKADVRDFGFRLIVRLLCAILNKYTRAKKQALEEIAQLLNVQLTVKIVEK